MDIVDESDSDNTLNYFILAKTIFEQAFHDILCFYSRRGTQAERKAGKEWVKWMRNMEGNFIIISSCFGTTVEDVHQLCLWKISQLKHNGRQRFHTTYQKVTED